MSAHLDLALLRDGAILPSPEWRRQRLAAMCAQQVSLDELAEQIDLYRFDHSHRRYSLRCLGARFRTRLAFLCSSARMSRGLGASGSGTRLAIFSRRFIARRMAIRFLTVMAPVFSKRLSGVSPIPLLCDSSA